MAFSLKRPSRLREEAKDPARQPVMSGTDVPAAEQVQINIDAVRATLGSPGWKVIQKYLNYKSSMLWDEYRNPRVNDERAATLRREAIKYSGIQDVIEEIMASKGK